MSLFKQILIAVFIYNLPFGLLAQSNLPVVKGASRDFVYFNRGDSLSISEENGQILQPVWMIYHAEEDTIGLDPGLSTRGRFRAIHLQKIFKEIALSAYYSTPFRNNILTLQPLIDSRSAELVYYDQADIAALVKKIDHLYPQPVIIVAHPETVGKIIFQLSSLEDATKPVGFLSDKILLLKRKLKGQAKLHTLTYTVR